MVLSVKNASVGYDGTAVLSNISLQVCQGEVTCLLGPNGIGKTTLFRSIMGFLPMIEGEVLLDSIPRREISDREFAKIVAYVPQSQEPSFPYSVIDTVVMGSTVHMKPFASPGAKEYHIADRILDLLGIAHLRDKKITQISGGERQMVLIARALIQKPKLLVMDEPTANLDFANQIHVLECIRGLSEIGLGVLMITHNPDHAFLCCDRVILITKGKEIFEGTVNELVTEENLHRAYGVDVRIVESVSDNGEIIKSCIPVIDGRSVFNH